MTFIITAIDPLIFALSLTHALRKMTLITVSVGELVVSFSMFFAIEPLTSISVPSIHNQSSLTLLFVILPSAFVYISIVIGISSMSIPVPIAPLPNILVSIGIEEFALSIFIISFPHASVSALGRGHGSMPTFNPSFHLSLESESAFRRVVNYLGRTLGHIIVEIALEPSPIGIEDFPPPLQQPQLKN